MQSSIFPAYLYTQYQDDDNIRSFFDAYNSISQRIVDWMVTANLPVFVGSYNAGDQLKWIAKGIYGTDYPVLKNSKTTSSGPFNTVMFGQLVFNQFEQVKDLDHVVASDDLFKRIMTWNFYKEDGFVFNIPWLKRRVVRFLLGEDGTDAINDGHWSVSVLFSSSGMQLTIAKGYRRLTDSTIFNDFSFNTRTYGYSDSVLIKSTNYQYATLFQQAFESGLLHLPEYINASISVIG